MTPVNTLEFARERLQANPETTFHEVRDAAKNLHGIPLYPVTYGRAKALLGLIPTAPRGQGKTARRTAARLAATAVPPLIVHVEPAPAPAPVEKPDILPRGFVAALTKVATDIDRYRATIEELKATIDRSLAG